MPARLPAENTWGGLVGVALLGALWEWVGRGFRGFVGLSGLCKGFARAEN